MSQITTGMGNVVDVQNKLLRTYNWTQVSKKAEHVIFLKTQFIDENILQSNTQPAMDVIYITSSCQQGSNNIC